MTVTREALLQAAYASTDDTERAVYADWLEQHGEVARAQIIHLQCELARTGPYDRRRLELEWEIEAVLDELGDRWTDDLPVLDGVTWIELERGLPSAVRVPDVDTLFQTADRILAAAPTVHTVELEQLEPYVDDDDLPAWPWLRTVRVNGSMGSHPQMLGRAAEIEFVVDEYEDVNTFERSADRPLERLTIRNNATVGGELVDFLATEEWARGLRELHAPTTRSEDADTSYYGDPRMGDEVANLAALAHLERLNIDRQGGGASIMRVLGELAELKDFSARDCSIKKVNLAKAKGASLDRLVLSNNAIGDAGAQGLAKAPRLRELKVLELDTCEISAMGLLELVRAPFWSTLRALDLSRNSLGTSAARALVELARPEHLHSLRLADCDFEEAAGKALGKVAWLGELTVLDLSGNLLGAGSAALRDLSADSLRWLGIASVGMQRVEAGALGRFWMKLVYLDASGNPITDAGVERFTTKEAAALQTLSLRNCKLGDDALELLARARCPRLRSLDLGANKFTAAGLEKLFTAPLMARLARLDLSKCELDASAIAFIAKTPLPPALQWLNLRHNDIDEHALVRLADSTSLRSVAKIGLDGNPYVFEAKNRDLLAARFGAGWYDDEEFDED